MRSNYNELMNNIESPGRRKGIETLARRKGISFEEAQHYQALKIVQSQAKKK